MLKYTDIRERVNEKGNQPPPLSSFASDLICKDMVLSSNAIVNKRRIH